MPDQTTFKLPSISAAEALERACSGACLVDLRKVPARTASGKALAGAEIRDPLVFGHDDPLTGLDGPVITFCVHGHEVSQFGCALLMLHGRDACYVEGGFEALAAAGAPLEDLNQ
ncbi:MAG: sulfurtransferase [Paracoccaceae bacterium]